MESLALVEMVPSLNARLRAAYAGRRVLVTGDSGFSGSWLCLWLVELGATVTGIGLPPETVPSLFEEARIETMIDHRIGDIRNPESLQFVLGASQPDYVFHLAAQALVRRSYDDPVGTFDTNVMGTVRLLDAVRLLRRPTKVVVVTSDKCYAPNMDHSPHTEDDRLGGVDPYSASKSAAELVVNSYRLSYFRPDRLSDHGVGLASARAGNVIGGGDWSSDRLIPDLVRAAAQHRPASLRFPAAIRPWQHVLEPLSGYLLLGAGLAGFGPGAAADYCRAWNFGPDDNEAATVLSVAQSFIDAGPGGRGGIEVSGAADQVPETSILRLSSANARQRLQWSPRWSLPTAIDLTARWYRGLASCNRSEDVAQLCRDDIKAFELAEPGDKSGS